MEISTRTRSFLFEVTIQADNVTVTSDVAIPTKDGYSISKRLIDEVENLLFQMARFSGISDVEMLKSMYENRLNALEQQELVDIITEQEETV